MSTNVLCVVVHAFSITVNVVMSPCSNLKSLLGYIYIYVEHVYMLNMYMCWMLNMNICWTCIYVGHVWICKYIGRLLFICFVLVMSRPQASSVGAKTCFWINRFFVRCEQAADAFWGGAQKKGSRNNLFVFRCDQAFCWDKKRAWETCLRKIILFCSLRAGHRRFSLKKRVSENL